MTIHGFGDMIGQTEIDSDEFKSLKSDLYVLTTGRYNLNTLSANYHKSAFI